ncbi:MAG: endonuclease/exonuclease/phosphatase family protein, partial [Candidatus ainarchaeum sp.]|nr:endonuclease/exonuclease/phosphatase family protein [Candidatus ainarchaeum sp.]
FGQKKASDENLMNYYVEKILNYDIVTVQEIRDSSQTAFQMLCNQIKEKNQNYNCLVSERSGTTSSKEQYGVIYKDINLIRSIDFTTTDQNNFERPPLIVKFQLNDWNFYIVTIHTKPEDVNRELANLEKLLSINFDQNDEIIILGDLNADCSYYKTTDSNNFTNWYWAITDNIDTTVSDTNCAYDRFIINQNAKNNFIEYGLMTDVNKDQSDHYLIWSKFNSID